MRPVASARPGNVNVFVKGRRWFFYKIRTSETFISPKKKETQPPPKKDPKDFLLCFLLKDLFVIFEEGCLPVFLEHLQKDVEEEPETKEGE